jgi:hypothetical protein
MNLAIPFSLLATLRFMREKEGPGGRGDEEKEMKNSKEKGMKRMTKAKKGGHTGTCLYCDS